ncbi:MAG: hypothetical protein SGBAC_012613, partial [Bacillariaceae sp.]
AMNINSTAASSGCNPCRGDQRPSSFQRHFIEQNNDVEATLVQGMKNLTFEQLQREQEDFHGVADNSTQEGADAIGEKLQSMDAHLSRTKAGTIYESAEAKDLAYVSNRDFRMLFLKGNRYDPKAAAEQMIRYFDIKHNLFGDECLLREITTQDLNEDDIASILAGTIQMSSCPDSSGRLISWGFPGIRANVPVKNLLRGIFFIGMDAAKTIEDTTKGIIVVSYQIGQYHQETAYNDGNFEAMRVALALPCNIAACHFCFRHIASLLTRLETMPFKYPSNELDLTWQKYWFQQCHERDQQKLQLLQSGDQCNQKGSEKHIKFLMNRWQGETPTDDDVLCVGRKVNGKGNERYMALAVSHADAFDNGSPKDKSMIVNAIMIEIKVYGRFLKLDTAESGGWIEVPDKEMRHKVAQTFRNLKNRRARSQAKSRTILEASGSAAVGAIPPTTSTVIVHQYTPRDVLFGRIKNHIGNQRLRELVQNVAIQYDAANRGEKLQIVQQLIETVKNEGGRFLKPLDGGRWEVVVDKDAETKVGAHFRNLRRKQWR